MAVWLAADAYRTYGIRRLRTRPHAVSRSYGRLGPAQVLSQSAEDGLQNPRGSRTGKDRKSHCSLLLTIMPGVVLPLWNRPTWAQARGGNATRDRCSRCGVSPRKPAAWSWFHVKPFAPARRCSPFEIRPTWLGRSTGSWLLMSVLTERFSDRKTQRAFLGR